MHTRREEPSAILKVRRNKLLINLIETNFEASAMKS